MFFPLVALLWSAALVASRRNTALFGERNISQFSDGRDLARYISRPELRPPILNVTQYDPSAISPGYWFVSPYGSLEPQSQGWQYIPFQDGPLIYDNAGSLIWSGAHMTERRHAWDFKVVTYNGSDHLTFIVGTLPHDTKSPLHIHSRQYGYIMDSAYKIQNKVDVNRGQTMLDLHEFNVKDEGRIALMTTSKVQMKNVSEVGVSGLEQKHVSNKGFQEIDLATGNINFEWDALDHGVSLTESYNVPDLANPLLSYWDFFHINAVDKTQGGDYIISARFTNTIYRISGVDGSIIWRFGGDRSDFEQLDGLNFTSQHNVRIRSENETVTMITFFDNASDDGEKQPPSARCSSGKLVALYTDTSPMTAKLIQHWDRPDGFLTDRRGNVEVLPNTNVVVNWGDGGFLSEFTADGRTVLDAQYASARFGNYRAYKFNFTGTPTEPPALKTYAYGSGMSGADMVSVYYVSWNGATEVAKWNFYGSPDDPSEFKMVGSAAKRGFETSYMHEKFMMYTYVEALSADGRILGKSQVQKTILPNGLDGELTDLSVPTVLHEDTSKEEAEKPEIPMARQSFGLLAVVFMAVLLVTSLLGMASLGYLLWNRKTLLSQRSYAPVSSSDTLDNSETSALVYHDQELGKWAHKASSEDGQSKET